MANYEVIWSPECEDDYTNIVSYLNEVWGVNAALRFMEKTERILEHLEQNPFMFAAVNEQKQIRRVVINKATSLYYYVSNDRVELLYFWNNRRNPANNPFG